MMVKRKLRMRNASGGEVCIYYVYQYVRQRLRDGAVDKCNSITRLYEIMSGIFNEDEGGGANCEMIFNVDREMLIML